jgi:hypothetical protein
MKKIKDFDNHQEKRIQEMRERFVVYNKMKKKKGKKQEVFKLRLREKK